MANLRQHKPFVRRFPIPSTEVVGDGQPIESRSPPTTSGRRGAATSPCSPCLHRDLSIANSMRLLVGAELTITQREVETMKKVLIVIAMFGLSAVSWADDTRDAAIDRLQHAGEVLRQIMATPDKGIPEEVLDHAKCIAVVPHLVKGGFIVGAEGGRGVATCRTGHGWSAPAFFDVEGGSWGLQIGVEGIDLVMVIQNDRGMQQ